jgi:hypothetical protein
MSFDVAYGWDICNEWYLGNDWQSCIKVEKILVDDFVTEPLLQRFANQIQGSLSGALVNLFQPLPFRTCCPYCRQQRFIVPLCRMSKNHRYPVPQCMECLLFRRGPRNVDVSVAPVSPMWRTLATSCIKEHAEPTIAVVAI